MKPIKQRGQAYVGFDMRLETLVDAIAYHPRNRRHFQHSYAKGNYLTAFRRLRGITRRQYGSINDLQLYACGVSHLDAAWLYPVVDTKLRAYKTFYKAVEHCEKYPFFIFAETAPQYYDWIRTYDPALYGKVKELVKAGRIEITGGMWIEPDLDMSSGESLVRQRLNGQLFYLREFGFMPKMESILDSFGFPYSLPQILIKSGATSFWTTKCSGTTPPAFYYWQGLDGSRIFTFQFYYNWDSLSSHKKFRQKARFPTLGKDGALLSSHSSNIEIEDQFSSVPNDYIHHFPLFYGLGDGGRGPLELEIMFADSLMKLHHGKHISQHEYIEKMRQLVGDRFFVWNDEMFLNMHHGTKTTQMEIKHYHRRAELWAWAAETLLTMMNIIDPDAIPINKPEIFEMWRLILFNEFHDILPGSSIPDVYILALKEFKQSIAMAQQIITQILATITTEETQIVVYNPFNWVRSEYIFSKEQLLYIPEIPPLSVQIRFIKDLIPSPREFETITQSSDHFILENDFVRALILKTSGTLISLQLKSLQSEFVDCKGTFHELGSGLRVFGDFPRSQWKAWDIDKQYQSKKIHVETKNSAKIITKPTGEMIIETEYTFLNSSAIVRFALFPKDPFIRLSIHVDLHDAHLLVKYFLPLNLESEIVTAEIPYGVYPRQRVKRTELEKMKWETLMQKWIDLSDSDRGVMIMNNNRYGFSATKHGIYLTLARTALYPGVSILFGSTRLIPPNDRPKFTDMKAFDFEFGIFPHEGTWQRDHLWQQAYNFNLPLITFQKEPSNAKSQTIFNGNLPDGFLHIDAPNIMIGAVKPPEWCGELFSELTTPEKWTWDKKSLIIRLVEIEGKQTNCILTGAYNLMITQVYEVDLLEMNPEPLTDNPISLTFHPYEIKTLRIQFE